MKYLALISFFTFLAFGADPVVTVAPAGSCVAAPGTECPPATRPLGVKRKVRKSPHASTTAAPKQAQAPAYITGQAARMTIGQTTFTAQDVTFTSATRLGAISGIAFAANTLFVTDSNKIQATPLDNRVLIYNNVSSFILPPTSTIPQGLRCPVCIGPDQPQYGPDVVVGQPDFVTTTTPYINQNGSTNTTPSITQNGFQTPTGVASDGNILVVTDTDNNRVLIWKTIPTTNDANADIVLGQPNFTTANPPPLEPTASSLRGPQGAWIQGSRLFIADTQNHRVLVWNNIPTSNNQPADYVLGEPNLTTAPPTTVGDVAPQANNLYSPVSVTSDGQRLFVTDLGHNRVLIWNSIPTTSQVPADVEVGQPDMISEVADNVFGACVSNGTDSDGNPTYPSGCVSFCPYTSTDSTTGTQLFPLMCGKTVELPALCAVRRPTSVYRRRRQRPDSGL